MTIQKEADAIDTAALHEAGVERFYDAVADHYECTQSDWDAWLQHNETFLSALIAERFGARQLRALDAAAGIGSQAVPLKRLGHDVVATDLSAASVTRLATMGINAQRCPWRRLVATFASTAPFDLILFMDNALTHTADAADFRRVLADASTLLTPAGCIVISLRDYDQLTRAKETVYHNRLGSNGLYHQEWAWKSDHAYRSTWVIDGQRFEALDNRCVLRSELLHHAEALGMQMAPQPGYFQPAFSFYW